MVDEHLVEQLEYCLHHAKTAEPGTASAITILIRDKDGVGRLRQAVWKDGFHTVELK